jgi:hypothetical protein
MNRRGKQGYTALIENINNFYLFDAATSQIFCLRQKCTYLALAPILAEENMNKWVNLFLINCITL